MAAELAIVRTESVPVEELQPGDRVILPNGRRVTVEYLQSFDDGATLLVRWWRPAERDEPGHPGAKSKTDGDGLDGRLLGSLIAVPPGHCWTVDRAERSRPESSRRSGVAGG